MRPRRPAAGGVCMWRQAVVLSLCVCLPAACSMRSARNQVVLPVGAAETERLRDLLGGKRIDASFADGARLRGRVHEVRDGLLTVNVNRSAGPNAAPRGLQDIPTERLSTVRFTRHKGFKRVLLGTAFFLGGYGLAAAIITSRQGWSNERTTAAIGVWSGMTIFGYLWGSKKDKQDVTLEIERPETTGGP